MGKNGEHLEMIKQAQLGSQDDMSRLAGEARDRVFVYIYRITLDYHLAEELSQETVLEMFKSLKRLKIESVSLFWAWVYRTALGKVQHNFRCQGSKRIEQKTMFNSWELLKNIPKDNKGGLEALLHKELTQIVFKAMGQMKVAYRNVLALRCFNEMSYAEIAEVTGVSEMRARLQFFRAKQALKQQLAENGYQKEQLLSALGLFGAITGFSSKSSSAAATVSSTAMKVGVPAAVIGAAASKTGILAATAAAVFIVSAFTLIKTFAIRIFPEKTIVQIVNSKGFEHPSSLIRANPNGWWRAKDYTKEQQPAIQVLPQTFLVGPREKNSYFVVLPQGHWLELGFSGEIIDGKGIDIGLDQRNIGALPLVFITDGAGQEVQITSAPVFHEFGNGYRMVGFDISGMSIPFKPRALRIVGADNAGPWGGAAIWGVWARVSR